ncbi:hypothetical protein JCM14469_42720 [Desulfatiferula olefinivorans]
MKTNLILIAAICLLSCSGDSNDISYPLLGAWRSQCNLSEDSNFQFDSYVNSYVFYDNGRFNFIKCQYEGTNCEADYCIANLVNGTYTIGNNVQTLSGDTATTFIFTVYYDNTPVSIEGIYIIEGDNLIFGKIIDGLYVIDPDDSFFRDEQ